MKKIGIMTLHIGDNYGALLQCYALRHCINSFKDCHAEIINYDPGREFPVYENESVQGQYLLKLEKFKEFNKVYNGITDEAFTDINDERAKGYDYYITGSDQVWNTSFSFAKEVYFLNFVSKEAKKIAYAASIGISVGSPRLKIDWFRNNIPQFDYISVREKSYVDFVQSFTDKKVYSVVDPTLLLNKKDYDKLCRDIPVPVGDYAVLYFLKHDNAALPIMEFTNMISRKYDLEVFYSFADVPNKVFKNKSETFCYFDPREFVKLISCSKVLITNSFHGTVFAIKNHIPFYTYLVGSMASRVVDLLTETGLTERIVRGYKCIANDMLDIDFSYTDTVLEQKCQESLSFLKNALEID